MNISEKPTDNEGHVVKARGPPIPNSCNADRPRSCYKLTIKHIHTHTQTFIRCYGKYDKH